MVRIFQYACVFMLCSAIPAVAQFGTPTSAQVDGTGFYSFGSYDSKGFDAINLGNLNSHFEIPIVKKQGRKVNFNYSIVYDGLLWSATESSGTQTWQPNPDWGFHDQYGTGYTGYMTHSQGTVYGLCPSYPGAPLKVPGTLDWAYVYHEPSGTNHFLDYSSLSCPHTDVDGPTITGDGSTDDGSGFSYNPNTNQLRTREGRIINAPLFLGKGPTGNANGSIVDTNGNKINNNGNGTFTDTLGVTALTISGNGNVGSPLTFTYPVTLQANQSTSATVTVYYRTYTVETNFQCSGISEYGASSIDLIDHITLPDSVASTYSFSYEPTPGVAGAVTGRLASITLPTGGTITYAYSGGCNNSGINSDGTPATLTRTTTDGTKSYARVINGAASTTTTTDESQNQAIYSFISGVHNFWYETERKVWQGSASGTPLQDRITEYNGQTTPSQLTTAINQTDVFESFNAGSQTELKNIYSSGLLSSSTRIANGSNLQRTQVSYNSLGEPLSVTSYDPSGSAVAQVSYQYDEQAPTATAGIPQHSAVSTPRGNQTSSHIWVGGAATLDSTTIYYDTGVPVSTTTPNGQTQYNYDSTQGFVTQTILPTPSSGVQLSSSASYDLQSGVQLSATGMDAGQTVQTLQYDPLLRPKQITYPDGGSQTYSYSATEADVATALNATTSANTSIQYDGYGRKSRIATYNGQGSNAWYQVDYCYDATGNLQFQSTAYQGNGFVSSKQCSGSGTTYSYDALGRITNVNNSDGNTQYLYTSRAMRVTDVNGVQKITQFDSLGRISAVCEISNNSNMPGSGAPQNCGMDIGGTGFLTNYSYDLANHKTTITQGGQQRVFQTDAVGRTIYTSEPERGATTYSYSYNSTGLVVTRQRPRANQSDPNIKTTTTTQYDSLGRVVSISYDDGTPNRTYTYDQSASWSEPQTNLKGLLSQANAAGAGAIFSYDSMGRVAMKAQCFPSECGNPAYDKQISYTYDWAGNITHENDPASGSIAYTRSPAGEVTSIVNETYSLSGGTGPTTLLSNVQYGPFGPVSWTMGNGLTGVHRYDGLGRARGGWVCDDSSQQGCSGGTQLYGYDGVWKGSRYTDECDTILNQCMTYGYDEFNRLTSRTVTQGVVQNFQYTYDRWGNRWQQTSTGGSGPQPSYTYNTGNNQIIGFSYDAAGNLMNDGSHSYTYDAEGNLATVDNGNTAINTYDALNNRIRTQVPNATIDSVFDAAGRNTSDWSFQTARESHIYMGAEQLAFRSIDGLTYFTHRDRVSTDRMHTDPSGASVATYTSLPFGDGGAATVSNNPASWDFHRFGGLDYSGESDTYHAQFRQYSSAMGRWMSPDFYSGSYDFSNPQSFNRYSYALNNPLSIVDPTGLDGCDMSSGSGGYDPTTGSLGGSVDTSTPEGCAAAGGFWDSGDGSISTTLSPIVPCEDNPTAFCMGATYTSNDNDAFQQGIDFGSVDWGGVSSNWGLYGMTGPSASAGPASQGGGGGGYNATPNNGTRKASDAQIRCENGMLTKALAHGFGTAIMNIKSNTTTVLGGIKAAAPGIGILGAGSAEFLGSSAATAGTVGAWASGAAEVVGSLTAVYVVGSGLYDSYNYMIQNNNCAAIQ